MPWPTEENDERMHEVDVGVGKPLFYWGSWIELVKSVRFGQRVPLSPMPDGAYDPQMTYIPLLRLGPIAETNRVGEDAV